MFRANPHPDDSPRNSAQDRKRAEQVQDRRRRHLRMRRQHLTDHAILNGELQALRDGRRQFAPALDLAQHVLADGARPQWRDERIGRGDSVLNRQIDSDAANQRHRVRGVADEQESPLVPALHSVHAHFEKFDRIPIGDLSDAVVETRLDLHDPAAELSSPRARSASNDPFGMTKAHCQY